MFALLVSLSRAGRDSSISGASDFNFWDEDDDDVFASYDDDYEMDEDEIISFLNEYYLIYPKRLPKPQMY